MPTLDPPGRFFVMVSQTCQARLYDTSAGMSLGIAGTLLCLRGDGYLGFSKATATGFPTYREAYNAVRRSINKWRSIPPYWHWGEKRSDYQICRLVSKRRSSMQSYRKRALLVEAIQINERNRAEIAELPGVVVFTSGGFYKCRNEPPARLIYVEVATPVGKVRGRLNDWIIREDAIFLFVRDTVFVRFTQGHSSASS